MSFGLGIFDAALNIPAMMFAEEQQSDMQQFNAGEAQLQRMFVGHQSNTAWQRAVADMSAAGINPMLAAKLGGADVGGAASASSGAVAPHSIGTPFTQAALASSQVALNSAATARTEAEAKKIAAEEAEVKARTPVHAVSIEKMQQEVRESQERVNKIMAETTYVAQEERSSAARQFLAEQQRRNLQEEIDKIRATVRNLSAQTAQQWASERQLSAHETEIRQRVRQNLPEVERLMKDLEAKAQALAMPGRGMDAAARNSFLGAWNAVVRALTGQTQVK